MDHDWIEHAVASRPKPGEAVSGDEACLVCTEAFCVAAVLDGLGHGPAAREAAARACEFVRAHADEPLQTMVRGLDRALVGSRGAAAAIVRIDRSALRLSFVGVGNVELRAHADERIQPLSIPGILGRGLRSVRVWDYPVRAGGVFALFTDGVSSRLDLEVANRGPLSSVSAALLTRYQREHDDALVLLVRLRP